LLWVALLGLLHTAAFAPLEWVPLQVLALAGLAFALRAATVEGAAWQAWIFAVAWLGSGLWWLYISLHDFGGLPAWLAVAAVLALAALLALYAALAMAAWAAVRGRSGVANGLMFAGLWLLSELARGQWFTGFPWIASGYAHTSGPLSLLAPWWGVYGVSAEAALLAAGLAAFGHAAFDRLRAARAGQSRAEGSLEASGLRGWLKAPPVGLLGLALLPLLFAALAPEAHTLPTGRFRVSLLQPNVSQDLKFDPQHLLENLELLREQMLSARGDLVVTPESVVPLPQVDLDPEYWRSLIQPFTTGTRGALIGTFLGDEANGYVNSMAGISAERPEVTTAYRYGKRHLLPFGEYVPPGFRWFVDLMHIPLGDQAAGQTQDLFAWGGQRIRPLICYEDLFGEEFAASTLGPQGATVLANASNLAWFGPWMMQDQHLQFSRMRALEFQRPLIRATNTGATAVIDHHGRVTARLPSDLPGVLEAEVEGRIGDTPYAVWVSRFGLWPAWALALVLIVPAVLIRRRGARTAI
jgi:apolipoprotein N-acyltransferase